ncbi:lasso peptide biosynthesis B2 protein [Brevundimonas sp.]|uniref:lasso peptide biosynthesis B2 protein n=1 Tax=Brevundimonas sp. TaxID=1871086 RepID=UPI0035ADB4CA
MRTSSSQATITAWWASHIHAARCAGDLVLLDTRSDAYLHVPDPEHRLELVDLQGVRAPAAYIEQLAVAGLLTSEPFRGRRPLPDAPRRSQQGKLTIAALRDAVRLIATLKDVGDVSLGSCLAKRALRPRPDQAPSPDAAVAVFALALPFIKGQGACLWRCAVLDDVIDRAGGYADWVFGVRLWPFSAHCWLQIGDAVLDDDPDRISLYSPILAI